MEDESQIWTTEMTDNAARMEVSKNACKVTTTHVIERHRNKWNNNTAMKVKEIGINKINWIMLAQDRDNYPL